MSATFTAIFCDDIRQEANGKHILIGVYGNDLVPGALPATFPLSLWLKVENAPTGAHKFKFSMRSPSGDETGVQGEMEIPEDAPVKGIVLAFGGLPVQVKSPGTIRATLSFDGGADHQVGSLQVLPVGMMVQR